VFGRPALRPSGSPPARTGRSATTFGALGGESGANATRPSPAAPQPVMMATLAFRTSPWMILSSYIRGARRPTWSARYLRAAAALIGLANRQADPRRDLLRDQLERIGTRPRDHRNSRGASTCSVTPAAGTPRNRVLELVDTRYRAIRDHEDIVDEELENRHRPGSMPASRGIIAIHHFPKAAPDRDQIMVEAIADRGPFHHLALRLGVGCRAEQPSAMTA